MTQLYGAYLQNSQPILAMDVASAELTKSAANAMLATRVSLMNELASICERTGADIEQVGCGVGSDSAHWQRLSQGGPGVRGSCLPKDVRALIQTAHALGEDPTILRAVDETNSKQRKRFLRVSSAYWVPICRGSALRCGGLHSSPARTISAMPHRWTFCAGCWKAAPTWRPATLPPLTT